MKRCHFCERRITLFRRGMITSDGKYICHDCAIPLLSAWFLSMLDRLEVVEKQLKEKGDDGK